MTWIHNTRNVNEKTTTEDHYFIYSLKEAGARPFANQAGTLGDREQPALDAGHGLQRRRLPGESEERGRSDEYSAETGLADAENL